MHRNHTRMMIGLLLWLVGMHTGWSFYNPQTGRWLSRDPIEEVDGPNMYGFVCNTAPNLIDRNGRESWALSGPGWSTIYQNGRWIYQSHKPVGPTRLPVANDVLLSVKDRLGFKPKLNEASAFQTNPRLSEATTAAARYFEQRIQEQLCASPNANVDVSQLSFTVNPASQGGAPANSFAVQMSASESSFVIGWYEYRLDFFRTDKTHRNRTTWRANIVVIDKLGWDEETYKTTFQGFYYDLSGGWFYDSDYFMSKSGTSPILRQLPEFKQDEARRFANQVNHVPTWIFGPVREFERARWTIFGEVCCDK